VAAVKDAAAAVHAQPAEIFDNPAVRTANMLLEFFLTLPTTRLEREIVLTRTPANLSIVTAGQEPCRRFFVVTCASLKRRKKILSDWGGGERERKKRKERMAEKDEGCEL
jgi:hypothetical protein